MKTASASDALRIQCPNEACEAKLEVTAEQEGKKVTCPECSDQIEITPRLLAAALVEEARLPAVGVGEGQFQKIGPWVQGITAGRGRIRTALRWALLFSMVIHVSVYPLFPEGHTIDPDQEKLYQSEYQKKIESARSASILANRIKDRIQMPPPPPDPEGVIEETLTESLTTDVEKVIGNLLDVNVTEHLARQVAASLEDELKMAAKDIVEGKLSEEEIKALHKKFQQKAHETTVKALKEHRIETQEERAELSTVEWYEKKVSRTLRGNLHYELYRKKYGRYRWDSVYFRSGKDTHWGRWGLLGLGGFDRKYGQVRGFEAGVLKQEKEIGYDQAEVMSKAIKAIKDRQIFDGRMKDQGYSWASALKHQLNDYWCHKREDVESSVVRPMNAAFKKAEEAVEEYLTLADEEADDEELEDARDAVFKHIKEVKTHAAKLFPDKGFSHAAAIVNKAVASRILRGKEKDEMYDFLIEEMVTGLAPLIQEFAQDQFKAGIIVWKDKVGAKMKDFAAAIVPLLRRDIQKLFPKKQFDVLVFHQGYGLGYRSKVTGRYSKPSAAEIKKDEAALESTISNWPPEKRKYVDARHKVYAGEFKIAISRIKERLLTLVLTSSMLLKGMGAFVEGVDYADKVEERLDARQAALKGRGQDLTSLTSAGVPDTSAPLVALLFGTSKGHGASLEPTMTTMMPGYTNRTNSALFFRGQQPRYPAGAKSARGAFKQQPKVTPKFKGSPRFEGIPFLTKFPRLDGDLSDWGEIRPLIMRGYKGTKNMFLYAAWNYQGFFFGYKVDQPAQNFYYPSLYKTKVNRQIQAIAGTVKSGGTAWAFKGDHLRLYFDTLDARNQNRGEPHTQEFTILPRGTDSDPNLPGMERLFSSQRDAKSKEYRKAKASAKIFPQQPGLDQGPDGSGPYRVTRFTEKGYTVEVFIPRTLFSVPVFAPGWYMGFDCVIANGYQGKRLKGQYWATTGNARRGDDSGLSPREWGDLLLLGTDPRVMVQNADGKYDRSTGIVPGYSYLLTVIDPDRNVSISQKDTVLVSAEAQGANGDVEVFILKETKKNSGIFRGFIDTQPGWGRQAQGVLEVLPGQELAFGYVDFANAKGERNTRSILRLPVVGSMMRAMASNK